MLIFNLISPTKSPVLCENEKSEKDSLSFVEIVLLDLLMHRCAKDACWCALGALIGYNADVTSKVEGSSMEPTLSPGDRILHAPSWLLPQSMWRIGSVVVAQVSRDIKVCKRIKHMGTTAQHVEQLAEVHWACREDQQPCASLSSSIADESEQVCSTYSLEKPENGVESGRALSLNRNAFLEEDGDGTPVEFKLRNGEWDMCRDKFGESSRLWVWLEGDNASSSFDSRSTGAVPVECISQLVILKWYKNIGWIL